VLILVAMRVLNSYAFIIGTGKLPEFDPLPPTT